MRAIARLCGKSMTFFYNICGFKLHSDMELPELPAWQGGENVAVDIKFCLASLPAQIEDADHSQALFQTRGDNLYLLSLPGTGRILVRGGREIVIDPDPGSDPVDTRAVLMGPLQAVLWHQRGLLPLHATVVTADSQAIALAGPSGAGKSTLAAALAKQGCKVIGDDMAVIEKRKDGEIVLRPGYPRLRLWQDVLDHFGISANGLQKALSHKKKFLIGENPKKAASTMKLSAVFVIFPRPGGLIAIHQLRGRRAIGALHRVVHMRRPARPLGRDPEIFSALCDLVTSGTKIWHCEIPRDLSRVDEASEAILNAVRQ
jgi:hypothetical protein